MLYSLGQTSFEWISQLRYYWEVDDRQQENMWASTSDTRVLCYTGRFGFRTERKTHMCIHCR